MINQTRLDTLKSIQEELIEVGLNPDYCSEVLAAREANLRDFANAGYIFYCIIRKLKLRESEADKLIDVIVRPFLTEEELHID